jgi:hypothetical protein
MSIFSQLGQPEVSRPKDDFLVDDSKESLIQELGEANKEIVIQGHTFGEFSLTVVLYDRDLPRIDHAISSFSKIFSTVDAVLIDERYNLLNAYLAVVPGNYHLNLRRMHILNTNYADYSFFFTLHQVAGGVLLGVQRVGGDDGPFQRERIEQLGELGNRVGLFFHSDLADDDCFLMPDGTEQVGSRLPLVVAPAQGFAVDGHGAPGQGMVSGQPWADFRIQPVGIDPLQHTAQGGLRGRLPAFRPQLLKRLAAESLSPLGNGTKAARPRQGRTDSDSHNGHYRMAHPARLTRVHQRLEQIHQSAVSGQRQAIGIDHPGDLLSLTSEGR